MSKVHTPIGIGSVEAGLQVCNIGCLVEVLPRYNGWEGIPVNSWGEKYHQTYVKGTTTVVLVGGFPVSDQFRLKVYTDGATAILDLSCEGDEWLVQYVKTFLDSWDKGSRVPVCKVGSELAWFEEMYDRGLMFHPEDDPRDIILGELQHRAALEGKDCPDARFTLRECMELDAILDGMCERGVDPCDLAYDILILKGNVCE